MITTIRMLSPSESLPVIDRDLVVEEILNPVFANGEFSYSVTAVPDSYVKTYVAPNLDGDLPISDVLVAQEAGHSLGIALLVKHWTGYGEIYDFAVSRTARGRGIGASLLQSAKEWAGASALLGLRAETQNTNVPACRLYSQCGFSLRGMDTSLYRGASGVAHEVALFWYWDASDRLSSSSFRL